MSISLRPVFRNYPESENVTDCEKCEFLERIFGIR